jgi:hypothetical protein
MRNHRIDLSVERFRIELERGFAVSIEVQIGIDLHWSCLLVGFRVLVVCDESDFFVDQQAAQLTIP